MEVRRGMAGLGVGRRICRPRWTMIVREYSIALRSLQTISSRIHQNSRPQRRGLADVAGSSKASLEEDGRERVVVLGSGWGGYVFARKLDPKKYRAIIVSPRPYFVFTPLLNDSAVGTLEFRNVLESIRKRKSHVAFLQGWADDVNFADKTVTVEPNVLDQTVGTAMTGPREAVTPVPASTFQLGGQAQPGGTGPEKVPTFPISYDKLVIAVGCYSQTFNTPGVRENALFLKDVNDARRIRRRILDLFELAKLPFIPEQTKRYLLHFAIVGGGPTGMEFAASLSDLIAQDLRYIYPDLIPLVSISLYDVSPRVLPMFDATLADYAMQQTKRHNIAIKTSHQVLSLRKGFPNDPIARDNQPTEAKHRVYTITTIQEGDVGIGMCVWSTGNMANPFVAKALDRVRRFPTDSASILDDNNNTTEPTIPAEKQWVIQRDPRTGLVRVDDHFRVQLETQHQSQSSTNPETSKPPASQESRASMNDVFAIGDTTSFHPTPLPGTAQVANQQALWLAKQLNSHHNNPQGFSGTKGFGFRNLGVMTYLGGSKAVLQAPNDNKEGKGEAKGLKGWVAYLIWRGAYLTMTLSYRNMILVPVQWAVVKVFGRDVSRF